MASFPPFKSHILSCLDELTDRYGLEPPFLDIGCGDGDVALHLALKGWGGTALDASEGATKLARATLEGFPAVEVHTGGVETLERGCYATVLCLDVLEHVRDDEAVIEAAARLQEPGASLVVTVPTNPGREWRWDDGVYGHLRRYTPVGLASLLEKNGYEPLVAWDLTFPFLWALRRAYTAGGTAPIISGTSEERSLRSARAKAWEMGSVSDLASACIPWRALFALQRPFRNMPDLGHEMMMLARRRARLR